MDIDDIKRVKQAMTAVDGETASNMLLGLLLDVYWQGRHGFEGAAETISTLVEGTRNV